MKEKIASEFKKLQDRICVKLEHLDQERKFVQDLWTRDGGGGGRTRIISNGKIFEKGGVNFSEVFGDVSGLMKSQLNLDGKHFYATGVSIVLHPHNPFHPIMHMNVRYFQIDEKEYWFGGGIDMTPHYVDIQGARKFHQGLKDICDKYDTSFYHRFKNWADDYFYIPHRKETRGVGGIFYDHIKASNKTSKNDLLNFAVELGDAFPDLYKDQLSGGHKTKFNESHLNWRDLRRGRYVEFNLIYDRGTQFGLKSDGRVESILMSLPQNASWPYNFIPPDNSLEARTLTNLRKGIDWINRDN